MGDRLFARLTRNGNTVVEIMSDRIGSMTDLLAELRIAGDGKHGLMRLYVRNHSKGWSNERPLMLYRSKNRDSYIESTCQPAYNVRPHMTFPWETH